MNTHVGKLAVPLAFFAALGSSAALSDPVEVTLLSDDSWQSWDSAVAGWEAPGFDDSGWRDAYAPYPYLLSYPPTAWIPGTSAVYMWDYPAFPPIVPTGWNGPIHTYYRKTFELPVDTSRVNSALVTLGADDDFHLFVNGTLAFSDTNGVVWGGPYMVDIQPYLVDGENLIAIHSIETGGWEWTLVDGTISYNPYQFSCDGFQPPANDSPFVLRGRNAALPLKGVLLDGDGLVVTDADAAAPLVRVTFQAAGSGDVIDVSDAISYADVGSGDNAFVYDAAAERWQFNLKTGGFQEAGSYTVSMITGNGDHYVVDPTCTVQFEREAARGRGRAR